MENYCNEEATIDNLHKVNSVKNCERTIDGKRIFKSQTLTKNGWKWEEEDGRKNN